MWLEQLLYGVAFIASMVVFFDRTERSQNPLEYLMWIFLLILVTSLVIVNWAEIYLHHTNPQLLRDCVLFAGPSIVYCVYSFVSLYIRVRRLSQVHEKPKRMG